MNKIWMLLGMVLASGLAGAQPAVDKIIAVVGNQVILLSELENQAYQMKQQGVTEDVRCELLEEMLFQKLVLHQAEIDSVTVTDEQVEMELDRRLRFFISQIGSEKALEEYYGKTITQIKEEFRTSVKDQLIQQQMQSRITSDINVTPGEVRAFFRSFPADSLPLISEEMEVGQILVKPRISEEAKALAFQKVTELRERIVAGEKMATLAVLYSCDLGSAKKGGVLGFVGRGTFVPEFEAVAFNLKPGEVSQPVETQFGYHIMELVERRGEQINVRHILICPESGQEDMETAAYRIDSVYARLTGRKDSLSFSEAARLYSDDEETKGTGGLFYNPNSGSSKFESDQLDPRVFFVADKMKVGQISEPMLTELPDGKQAYRILYLKSRTEPHRANLSDDYQRIQEAALEDKKAREISKWIRKKVSGTYIRIDDKYSDCNLEDFLPAKAQK